MRVVVVNPNKAALQQMTDCIKDIHQEFMIEGFTDSMLAYQFAFNNSPIDYLYTVVDMKRLDGFSLARMMRADNSRISINLCSEDDRYRTDAEKFGCDSYLHLPLTYEAIKNAEEENDVELILDNI